jgi:cytochrome c biogenesis protein CcdA
MTEPADPSDRLTAVLTLLGRLSGAVGAIVASRASQFAKLERREVGRAARVFAYALCAALLVSCAAGFAALAIVVAAGEAHRVLAAGCLAAAFALGAAVAALLARQNLRDK